jgi:hypothetical protein
MLMRRTEHARKIIQEDVKTYMFACIYAKCITASTALQHKDVHDHQMYMIT